MKIKCRCVKCRAEFEYEPVQVQSRKGRWRSILRYVCDECREARARYDKKKWKKHVRAPVRNRGKAERRANMADGYECSLAEVGRRLGLDTSTVEMVQRSVLKKIRSSPELREAFAQYSEAGMPRIKELLAGVRGRDERSADRLLEMQLQVADFWAAYERLQAEARQLDSDPPPVRDLPLWRQRERRAVRAVQAEMAEIMAEIVQFQNLLQKDFEA